RSRMSLSTFAPPAFVGPVAVPAAAVLATVQLHLDVVLTAPPFVLPWLGALGGWLSGHGILLQHDCEPLEQAGFIGIAYGELDLSTGKRDMTIDARGRLG